MMPQEYRLNFDMVSYSEIKLFSQCPRLYFEQYVLRTHVQADKDYFTYGQVADALLTQPWTLDEKFVRVSRKSDGGYLKEVEEMQKLEAKIAELEPQADANKTKAKSLAKARLDLEETRARIVEMKSIGERIQVTGAIWDNAHETAEVIKRNPFYASQILPLIETNRGSFQQMIYDMETHGKGTLDILYLSPGLQAVLDTFRAGTLTKQDALEEAAKVEDKTGFIVDIKTTFAMSKMSPVMYAAQLGYYQSIIQEILGVKLPCFTVVGDKDSTTKVAQDFAYSQDVLDRELGKLLAVKKILLKSLELYKGSQQEQWFPSAKILRGVKQDCFTCSRCKERPYSIDAPYQVTMKDVMEYDNKRR